MYDSINRRVARQCKKNQWENILALNFFLQTRSSPLIENLIKMPGSNKFEKTFQRKII